jgi:hypothetical protein
MTESQMGNDGELVSLKLPGVWAVAGTEGLSSALVPGYPLTAVKVTL